MRTIRLTIAFDGTGYCGWQRQHNGVSIQQELERAASTICNQRIDIHGAGRTDAGVHAVGMTAHFRAATALPAATMQKGMNALLPAAIRVISLLDEAPSFHARFSALAKTYRYAVYCGPILLPQQRLYTAHLPYPLDRRDLQACLAIITGTHDFSSFETTGSRDRSITTGRGAVRTIFRAALREPEPGLMHLCFTGDGFLRHMVRNLAGTMLEVGRGKRTVEEFRDIVQLRDRNRAGATAPAHGLTLMAVHYAHDW